MVKPIFDTNVLIYYLNGVPEARDELQRYPVKAITIISWIEVMVGADEKVRASTPDFLEAFEVIALDERGAERTVRLRRDYKLKLSDAAIWASAQVSAMLLVTRDTRDFQRNNPGIYSPYVLGVRRDE